MSTHYIKQGATLPKLVAQFKNSAGVGTAIADGTVVLFRARRRGDESGTYRISAAAQVDDAVNGWISYTFEEEDTADAGLLICEFLLTLGADVQKIPTVGFDYVMVTTGL